jgi:hypothetical protein
MPTKAVMMAHNTRMHERFFGHRAERELSHPDMVDSERWLLMEWVMKNRTFSNGFTAGSKRADHC